MAPIVPLERLGKNMLAEIFKKLDNVTLSRLRNTASWVNRFVEKNRKTLSKRTPLGNCLELVLCRNCDKMHIRKEDKNTAVESDFDRKLSAIAIRTLKVQLLEFKPEEDDVLREEKAKKMLEFIKELRLSCHSLEIYDFPEDYVLEILKTIRGFCFAYIRHGDKQRTVKNAGISQELNISAPFLMRTRFFHIANKYREVCADPCSMEFLHSFVWELFTAKDIGETFFRLNSYVPRDSNAPKASMLKDRPWPQYSTMWNTFLLQEDHQITATGGTDRETIRYLHLIRMQSYCILIAEKNTCEGDINIVVYLVRNLIQYLEFVCFAMCEEELNITREEFFSMDYQKKAKAMRTMYFRSFTSHLPACLVTCLGMKKTERTIEKKMEEIITIGRNIFSKEPMSCVYS